MRKYYNIDYSQLSLLLLPVFLRKKTVDAFASSFVKTIEYLHNDFTAYMDSLIVRINAQVCYMQSMLNDEFDYYERRIKVIQAAINIDYYLLWKENQNKPVMLSKESANGYTPYLLSKSGQIGASNIDFEVVLPDSFSLSTAAERRMKTLINRNKLASKKYKIINGQD
jgi:hypothetical protein